MRRAPPRDYRDSFFASKGFSLLLEVFRPAVAGLDCTRNEQGSGLTYAHKVDSNQEAIVGTFEKMGCSVVNLSRCGTGIPDLAVSIHLFTALVEVKAEKGMLTPDQIRFHRESKATIYVARNLDDVVEIVGKLKKLAFARTPE